MTSNFLATPQPFILSETTGVHSFFAKVDSDDQDVVNGAVVTSPDAPGSVAYVAAGDAMYGNKPSQRILMMVRSPKAPVLAGTLEFTAIEEDAEGQEIFGALAGLALNIIPKLLGANVNSAEFVKPNMMIPLLVGPSSVIQDYNYDPSAERMEDEFLSTLLNVAKTVVPAIAPVALDVVKQLTNTEKAMLHAEAQGAETFDFLNVVGDIVKVAAPVAAAALGELGKQIK